MSLGDEESCVPLMLLLDQKSATLILPANWGLPFWVAFQYAGARPGEFIFIVMITTSVIGLKCRRYLSTTNIYKACNNFTKFNCFTYQIVSSVTQHSKTKNSRGRVGFV